MPGRSTGRKASEHSGKEAQVRKYYINGKRLYVFELVEVSGSIGYRLVITFTCYFLILFTLQTLVENITGKPDSNPGGGGHSDILVYTCMSKKTCKKGSFLQRVTRVPW